MTDEVFGDDGEEGNRQHTMDGSIGGGDGPIGGKRSVGGARPQGSVAGDRGDGCAEFHISTGGTARPLGAKKTRQLQQRKLP